MSVFYIETFKSIRRKISMKIKDKKYPLFYQKRSKGWTKMEKIIQPYFSNICKKK